jgi:tetratricopeptide (TPR) repeat protein
MSLIRPKPINCNESYALGNLGILAKDNGTLDEALNYYSQTLAIAEDLFDPTGEANALWNMALLYKEKKEIKQAAKLARKALKIYDQTGDHNANMVEKALKNWRKQSKKEVAEFTEFTSDD